MCPLCLATLAGAVLTATGSAAAVTAVAARILQPKKPEAPAPSKGEDHAQDRVS